MASLSLYSTVFFPLIGLVLSGLMPINAIKITSKMFADNQSSISQMLLNEIKSENIAMFLK